MRGIYIFKPTSYLINLLSYPWKGAGAVLMYHRVLPDTQMADSEGSMMQPEIAEIDSGMMEA